MAPRDRVPAQRDDAHPQRPDAAAAASHPLLALQRTAGNRATRRALARLAIKSDDLGSTGGIGKVKAVVGMSDYTKLRETLDQFHRATTLKARGELVARMKALAGRWLKANFSGGSKGNAERVRKVQDLLFALADEETSLTNQGVYVDRLRTNDFTWLSSPSKQFALGAADALAAGGVDAAPGADADALRVVQGSGLTEFDIAAIRLYSLDEFKYINPAMAGKDGWLKDAPLKTSFGGAAGMRATDYATHIRAAERAEKARDARTAATERAAAAKAMFPADWKGMAAEGREHGEMVAQALKKLPHYPNKTYRGVQLTKAEFKADWFEGNVFQTNYFYSTSRSEKVAEFFAHDPPQPNKPIKAVMEIEQLSGRDISALSGAPAGMALAAAGLKSEEEVLLLPGAWIEITGIDREATPWRVYARELTGPKPPSRLALPAPSGPTSSSSTAPAGKL